MRSTQTLLREILKLLPEAAFGPLSVLFSSSATQSVYCGALGCTLHASPASKKAAEVVFFFGRPCALFPDAGGAPRVRGAPTSPPIIVEGSACLRTFGSRVFFWCAQRALTGRGWCSPRSQSSDFTACESRHPHLPKSVFFGARRAPRSSRMRVVLPAFAELRPHRLRSSSLRAACACTQVPPPAGFFVFHSCNYSLSSPSHDTVDSGCTWRAGLMKKERSRAAGDHWQGVWETKEGGTRGAPRTKPRSCADKNDVRTQSLPDKDDVRVGSSVDKGVVQVGLYTDKAGVRRQLPADKDPGDQARWVPPWAHHAPAMCGARRCVTPTVRTSKDSESSQPWLARF
ncbi:hypothetical protein C8R44DRAFT_863781 [Mycena epipterygia]|nr:hypothetical protein C8R44DRAFT_863781 [Mycena epipterygia]